MLKAIFFDAVGTLIHLPRPVGEHYQEVGARFGLNVDAKTLETAFRAAWVESPSRVSGNGPRADDDKGWWKDLISRVLRRTLSEKKCASFDTDSYFEAVYAHFGEPGVWAVFPEVPDVLQVLHERRFDLGIISNFDRRLYQVLNHLNLAHFFRAIVISSEVGADKPDPAIFENALDQLGVPAQQVMHVGDDPKCDWGASALGLPIFRLARPRHTLWDLVATLDGTPSP